MPCTRALPSFASLTFFGLAIALAASGGVYADQKPPGKLPTGSDVLSQHIKATGGQRAYDKIKNRVTKATLTVTGQGIKLSTTTYSAKPDKSYTLVVSDLVGKIEQGTSGGVAWSITTQLGPVVKKGAERASTLRLSAFDGFVYWKKYYRSAKCTGTETVKKKLCYKVVLTPKPTGDKDVDKSQKPTVLYIDSKSHLLVKRVDTLSTAMGNISLESFPGDFRKVDGILIPYKTQIKVLGQERVVELQSVKQNVDLPKNRFDLPKAIQDLVEKEKNKK